MLMLLIHSKYNRKPVLAMEKQHNLLILIILWSSIVLGQNTPLGIFSQQLDIGNPAKSGSASYDEKSQEYHIRGAGYNIWFNRDEFHYLFNELEDDFILTANFEFVGKGVEPHRKTGWMVRASDDAESAHISAVVHGDGLTTLQWRALRGAYMRDPKDQIKAPKPAYTIIQLERIGSKFIMRAAHPGEPLQVIGMKKLPELGGKVLAGLFVCSHNPDVTEEVKVWNVRIVKPVPDDYQPYIQGFIGSRLEVMNVFDGKRKIIYESDVRFEAPNWMPDGKRLLFNMNGELFKIPVVDGELERLNTGNALDINNDHGISFNGKILAISSRHLQKGEGSAIYVLPLGGGEPKLVTDNTPSYWHGWNPNNKSLVYVAKRKKGEPYNIFEASIKTGEETRITDFSYGHVDGPEYSPDGKYIYYNGSQSGTMQIWRMKPDGTGREQLTFDQYNNWFPHISPDGKWIVYLAFPETIPVDSHPSYKRVTLNLMPADGGPPRVIAWLYGGQGTINVPSWSPDSKNIAFVSNSGK